MTYTPFRAFAALLLGSTLCAAASADAIYQFTDDKNSANYYQSAANLTLSDYTDALLGSGVMFTMIATLTDPIFGSGSKISDLAFNGPNGTFNNFSNALYATYRGDVLVDAMSYTGGDGASASGIKFNWTDSGAAFDAGVANAFTNGKTSSWFIGGQNVAGIMAAEFQNPFAILHVNALNSGTSMWLLDGAPPEQITTVAEPQAVVLALTALGLMGWTTSRRRRAQPGA